MGKNIVITNNPLVKSKYQDKISLEYYDIGYLELLMKVRDKVHLGYKLLTHPLSSSVKPNETPYKTIIISEGGGLDADSLLIIENSILTTKKFLKDIAVSNWEDKILEDFQVVDLSIIEPAINKIL
ncbi:GrdX family protein [Sporanaerobacter acetigenes]|uniref:GrdX family protein n=1 Tax=Sporanaerobacter acetigenes TaxID=165813 RepID=UPI001050C057|nr:GrdX family protein [Sporanaerobacter acetigenes]